MKFYSLAKKISLILFIGTLVFLGSCKKADDDDPIVTADEDLYINEIYASGDDWIELFNNTSASKDLAGYKIYDDPAYKYTLPAGTVIPGEGYLVLEANDGNTGLNTNFKLTSSGETVYLENKKGDVIDKVIFPSLLNNQAYGRFPDGSSTLAITGSPTKGAQNSNAPSITEVKRSPLVPGLTDAVSISTQFATSANLSQAKLYYRFNNGAYIPLTMTLSAGLYTATIPAMNETGKVEYYIEAVGNSGGLSYRPSDAPGNTYQYLLNTDELPPLVINEFMALNTSCCADEVGEFEDWIELYNPGPEPVNIAGYYLSDDVTNPFNSRIRSTNASETTIPAGGYLIIWADGDRDQGERHVDFRLSQSGEAVGLYYIDGRKIDEHTFGIQNANVSTGRLPNGTGSFRVLSSPSPGQANQ